MESETIRLKTSWLGVFLGLAAGALAAFHQFKLPPAMPLMLELYEYDLTFAGGFMSVYALVGLATSALLGVGLQKFGTRHYVAIACSALILGSLFTILWPSLSGIMLAARAVEGLGFSILAILGPVIAISSANLAHRPLAIAIFASWIPLGQLIALGISQPAIALGNWRLIWWFGIAITVIIALSLWFINTHQASRKNYKVLPKIRIKPSVKQKIAMIFAALIFTLWSAQYLAMSTWLPHYLVSERGLTPTNAIGPYAIPTVVIIIFNIAGGVLLRRGVPIFPLLAIVTAIQGLLWLFFDTFNSTALGITALVIYGAAAGITPTCLFSMPNIILGQSGNNGPAFGVIMTGRHLGVLAGPIILPQLMITAGSWNLASLVFGIITLAAGASALGLGFFLLSINKNKTA